MALTYLDSKMIELPAEINNLSTNNLTAANLQSNSIQINNASVNNISAAELTVQDINFPTSGGDIYNSTNIYGNLTITGSITALSGLQVISTMYTTTTAVSVVNTGAGTALYVSQETPGIDSVAEFKGTGVSILKVNNSSPDNEQSGVDIYYTGSGGPLRASNAIGSNVFVVTSGDRVGVNTNTPRSEFEVNGLTRSTTISALTGSFSRVVTPNLSSVTIQTSNFITNTLNANIFNVNRLVPLSSFSDILTANNAQINLLAVNTVNALTGRFEVLDVTKVELSGFQINGVLQVTDTITTNLLTANNVNTNLVTTNNINSVSAAIQNITGNFNGDVVGTVFGQFQGGIVASGSIDGDIKINPGTTTAPTASSTPGYGAPGRLAFDSNFLYVCIANDTWKRVALSAWN
jgi:hypothetical protein